MKANASLIMDDEQQRKLAAVYRYILSLSEHRKARANKDTTPIKTLTGTVMGVADGDAQRQPRDHYTSERIDGQSRSTGEMSDARS